MPPPQIRAKTIFSDKNRVKFGHFFNFSGKYHVKFGRFVIFHAYIFGQKCLAPPNLTEGELLRLWILLTNAGIVGLGLRHGPQFLVLRF